MDENVVEAPSPPEPRNPLENGKDRKKALAKSPSGEIDHFLLGRLYPEPHNVFKSTAAVDPSAADVIVALDTNALLLPYQLGKSDLAGLATVYAKLAGESRLFLPEQVAREFIKNRDRKLADMVQALEDRTSRLSGWDVNVSPLLLEGFADREALTKAASDHEEATKAYLSQLRALAKQMKAWRGDDPVSALYAATFGKEQLIGAGGAE
ncbi:PIN-like domain-containing protein [Mesorhizobium yinganensis]|uniref:PIN-like domain-containing protein n=1 Tax=Mesorhizobium yinganensis TaxID=3157707 RepID=UPI0032B7E6B8